MGTKHAGILEPALRVPPLSGPICPDPAYAAGRALVLQGPQAFLGARWVFTASAIGQAAAPPPPIPPPPTGQGGIPFVDVVTGYYYDEPESPDAPEGSTAYAEEDEPTP
jgi:hypothetical protein